MRFRTTSGLYSAVDPIHMKDVTFEHVKGVEEAKNELQDVVEFLKNPQKFTVLGGKLPKGIIISSSVYFNVFDRMQYLLFPNLNPSPQGFSLLALQAQEKLC